MENTKITLKLENFRCWPVLNIEFDANEIILLKGDNGVGKSTILNSIHWILYGKIKNIAPNTKPKSKTRGILDFGFMIIERYNNPCTLKVTLENKLYDGDVAQNIIYEKFGTREVWLSSCYVLQDCRNSFLSVSNKEKIELLNKIAFATDDPSIFIEKVDSFTLECNKEYEIFNKNYTNQKILFDNKWKDFDFGEILDGEKVDSLGMEISVLKEEKKKSYDQQASRKSQLQEIQKLNEEIEKRQLSNEKLPDDLFLFDKVINQDEIEHILLELSECLPNCKKLEEIKLKLDNIEDFPVDKSVLEAKREELLQVYRDESIYNNNKKILDCFGLQYNRNSVQGKIEQWSDMIRSQPFLNIQKKIKDYKSEFDSINIKYPTDPNPNNLPTEYEELEKPDLSIMTDKINSLQNEMNQNNINKGILEQKITELTAKIERSKTALPCPHCKNFVKYTAGKIVPFDEAVSETDTNLLKQYKSELVEAGKAIEGIRLEINNFKKQQENILKEWENLTRSKRAQIDDLKKKIYNHQLELEKVKSLEDKQNKICKKIEFFENELNEMGPVMFDNNKLLSTKEIEELTLSISKLSGIVFVDIPVSSSQIKQEIEKMELQMERCKLLAQIELISIPKSYSSYSFSELSNMKSKIQNHIKEYQTKLNLIENNQKRIQELIQARDDIVLIADQTEVLKEIEDKITEIKTLIELNEKKIIANQEYIKMIEMREQMDAKLSDLADLKTIKKLSMDTKCESLDRIADEINIYIDEICSNLFDEPLSIEISMNKKLKSGNIVQKVNLAIDYRNCHNVDFDNFSGGEKTKISLALTIALNNISSCPILLLDEIYGPLRPELREEVTKLIKAHSINKTIICVSHDNFNDAYDAVIDLDTFSKKNDIVKKGPISRFKKAEKKV